MRDTPQLLVWTAGQVAFAIGLRSETAFFKRQAELETHGFPRKLPGLNAWSIAAVKAWVLANGDQAPAPMPAAVDPVSAELEARYALPQNVVRLERRS